MSCSASDAGSGYSTDDVAQSAEAARTLFADAMADAPGTDDLEWLRQLPRLLSKLWQSLGHKCLLQVKGVDTGAGVPLRTWLSCPAREPDVALALHVFRQARV